MPLLKHKLMVLRLFDRPLDHLRRHENVGGFEVKFMYKLKQSEDVVTVDYFSYRSKGSWFRSLRNGMNYLCELEEQAWLNEFQNAYRLIPSFDASSGTTKPLPTFFC
mmetsp:Transcript_25736/g.60953  ORF Transcript_25736/g.60953 Transcript_25736/m.60953 type:complete len:107 (-) Transcript_25736:103-423(-)